LFPDAKGILLGVLFNEAGALQDEVPPDVATDSTIPDSLGTKRLEGIISCITCHSTKGKDGWQPLANDVAKKLAAGFDVFGERDRRGNLVFDYDTTDRQRGLYTRDFQLNLDRARDDLALATLQATGPWEGSEDQADVCGKAAAYLHDFYYEQWLGASVGIGARQALLDMGLDVPAEIALKTWREIMTADASARILDVNLEDPIVSAISSGIGVNRTDFVLRYSSIMQRAQQSPVWRKLRGMK
jgi:hypothetical protein